MVALVLFGLAVSIVGWRASWFGDVDTGGDFTAGGGAFVFWLIICLPLAVGAALGVFVMRSKARGATTRIQPYPSSRRQVPSWADPTVSATGVVIGSGDAPLARFVVKICSHSRASASSPERVGGSAAALARRP